MTIRGFRSISLPFSGNGEDRWADCAVGEKTVSYRKFGPSISMAKIKIGNELILGYILLCYGWNQSIDVICTLAWVKLRTSSWRETLLRGAFKLCCVVSSSAQNSLIKIRDVFV